MDHLIRDIRHALRTLGKAKGFTLVAVVTLALGIGATTAMFSVVNAVLLRPLPFRDPQQLVGVGEFDTRLGTPEIARGGLSYPDLLDVRARNRSFQDVAIYSTNGFTVTGAGQPLHVNADNVSPWLFQMLGVQPVLGRTFLPDEDQKGHRVVILSDAFWRSRFNSDPGAIGRSINLDGQPHTIVGIMPRGFQFPISDKPRDMWVTFTLWAEQDDPKSPPMTAQRGAHFGQAIARLKPGVTVEQARADLAGIAHTLSSEYADSNSHAGISAAPEIDHLVGKTKTPILVLFGAVGLVLLIACANVANLVLARSSSRGREIAIRAALGATRARIVRQLVTESVVLALGGAALGVGIAEWALSAVLSLYPANLPRAQEVSIDIRVLFFTIGIAVFTGVLFGLAPALQVSAPNLTETMREGSRGSGAGATQSRLRSALVVSEVALGVMLLIGAGLLMRSLYRLSHADLGFNPDHVLTATFDLSQTRYDPDQKDRFVGQLMERLSALPGVSSAAGTLPLPLYDDTWSVSFDLVAHPVPKANQPSAGIYLVQPGFFETLQIPLIKGRTFDARDQRNSAPVMIINAAMAKEFFGNQDPIGQVIKIGAGEGTARQNYKTREIVGVVGDMRTADVARMPAPAYYIPLPQLMWGSPNLLIRTAGDPAVVATEIRKTLSQMEPEAPLYDVKPMTDYLALDLGRARFQAVLLAAFAGLALILTAIGLYGVLAYAVAQRTHEIGVRMALGASRSDVLGMVLRRGVSLTLVGMAVGVVGAIALAKVIQSLLYEIPPRDPATYVAVCVALAAVAILASYIPALRATRVDPMVALRYE